MDGTAMNLTDKIDRFFKISERGSSIKNRNSCRRDHLYDHGISGCGTSGHYGGSRHG